MSWILGLIIGLVILFVVINALFKRGNHYWTREEDGCLIRKEEDNSII